jgi:sigma-B regulation protein RsbU (phosphoserine phosphatase)
MIGAFDELPFINQGELDIEPGSLIVNYTDGLLDYEPADAEFWNEEVLMDFLIQNGELSPDKFNQALLNELNGKVKSPQIDDITLLTLRIF